MGGLSMDTTEEDILVFLKVFGSVQTISIVRGPPELPGSPRPSNGFGFALFHTAASVDNILREKAEGGFRLKGKSIEIRRATPREDLAKDDKLTLKTRRMFVGQISGLSRLALGNFFPSLDTLKNSQSQRR
ncbi:Heterogeneous nuclear ribonucleoprotein D-like [Holothuria leucospilota]|uniref:Heterogeneous nuclear ribonucleoprotein D-like n=1 Tax=Holothuria leucospilota TaxID=206669 RepID=A0A9Q1BQY5_HOLLE|nr:Heterogeneous nuclear ribonucleoprotein D-like [Holothuria leucospilota]